MSVSVSGMNETSKYIFNGVINTTASAWAASHLLEASPVGVLWGLSNVAAGAVFGATSYAVRALAGVGIHSMLPLADPKATRTTKLVAALATTLLGMVGGFFALKAIGIALTVGAVVNLAVTSLVNALIMQIGVSYFCGDKQPVDPVPPVPAAQQARV